jgi:uncharacterized membrane protein YqjE
MNNPRHHERSLGEVLSEIRNQVVEFLDTRLQMLRSEMQEAAQTIRRAAPSMFAGIALLATSYILVTLAIVALVAVAFWSNPYHWFFAFLIVGVVWAVAGATAMFMAFRAIKLHALAPRKTIEVLKADKVWLQYEVGSRL